MAARYRGPYLDQSPDLVVGYADGYRVSWEAAVGKVAGDVVSDNRKCWSGDHCVDPRLVPGVLFCNRPVPVENPSIVDLAPTILGLYGVRASAAHGRPLARSIASGHEAAIACCLARDLRGRVRQARRDDVASYADPRLRRRGPELLDRFMAAGSCPSFARLAALGHYQRLGTTIPPQSPVAWSTFITGLDPGGHGIYDFIHRDPAPPGGGALAPFLSTSRVEDDGWKILFGRYTLPLRSGTTELLRHGKAFWNVLEEHGVPATVVKIPANFPPEPSEGADHLRHGHARICAARRARSSSTPPTRKDGAVAKRLGRA